MLECDLVMKGGVTSATVYPKAIAKLAEDYRFRSVGGTSAGAIAAAAAAAAEFRRQESPNQESRAGFEVLESLPMRLGQPGAKGLGPTLLELFQPQPAMRSLFLFLLSFVGKKPATARKAGAPALRTLLLGARVCGHALRRFPVSGGVGALASLGLALLLGFSDPRWWSWVVLGALMLLGASVVALLGVWRTALRLPSNDFGMCRGFERRHGHEDATHLTSWLHAMLQETAGMPANRPLTFGDLERHRIDLRVVTSNLGYGHPHQLPFRSGEAWPFFDKQAWAAIFPADVIEHLERSPPERCRNPAGAEDRAYAAEVARLKAKQGLLPLPDAHDLPAIVAVRLSLSFPILLSAVPVWFLDPRERGRGPARRCWLSDGGISSNFPLHFFDRPIPGRPTLAINLEEVPQGFAEERVWLARTNRDGLHRAHTEIGNEAGPADLAKFLIAIVSTMQNWRDNSLLRLPGFRDRVAVVRLEPHEGGLNLNMDEERIARLAGYGANAAEKLALHFNPAKRRDDGIVTTWENHQWVRLLLTLAGLETLLREAKDVWEQAPQGARTYAELLDPDGVGGGDLPSYESVTPAQRRFARDCIVELQAVIEKQRATYAPEPLAEHAPRPSLRFRLTSES